MMIWKNMLRKCLLFMIKINQDSYLLNKFAPWSTNTSKITRIQSGSPKNKLTLLLANLIQMVMEKSESLSLLASWSQLGKSITLAYLSQLKATFLLTNSSRNTWIKYSQCSTRTNPAVLITVKWWDSWTSIS